MVQVSKLLPTRSAQDITQAMRWVMTKEDHAEKIMRLTADYLLAQRVKPSAFSSKAEYAEALVLHHALLMAAMKAKQTVDVAACEALVHAIDDIAPMYGA